MTSSGLEPATFRLVAQYGTTAPRALIYWLPKHNVVLISVKQWTYRNTDIDISSHGDVRHLEQRNSLQRKKDAPIILPLSAISQFTSNVNTSWHITKIRQNKSANYKLPSQTVHIRPMVFPIVPPPPFGSRHAVTEVCIYLPGALNP
jgi:hypothetical protein